MILPVDQGFEHGPARSFAPNPAAYDPHYLFELAIEAGLNAYAAPLGMIEAGAATYAGAIPLILKVNSSNSLSDHQGPGGHRQRSTMRCGSAARRSASPSTRRSEYQFEMMEELREMAEEAKAAGLAVGGLVLSARRRCSTRTARRRSTSAPMPRTWPRCSAPTSSR